MKNLFFLFSFLIISLHTQAQRADIYSLRPAPDSLDMIIAPRLSGGELKWKPTNVQTWWANLSDSARAYISSEVISDGRGYKVYTALLTQTGTDVPVATVLENTLGTVSYEYAAEGIYLIKLNGGNFVRATTFILLGFPTWDGGDDFKFSYGLDGTDSPVTLVSAIASSDTPANGAFLWQPIEIRVYD